MLPDLIPLRGARLVSVLLVVAAAGCSAFPGRQVPSAGAIPTKKTLQAAGSASTAWPESIPDVWLTIPGRQSVRQRGVLIAAHWFRADGSVLNLSPDGKDVQWPIAASSGQQPSIRLSISLPRAPDLAEVRVFDKGVTPAGVPQGSPATYTCSQGADLAGKCRYMVQSNDLQVDLGAVPGNGMLYLVFYAEWYVPYLERPARSRTNPVTTASWGFRLDAER